MEIEDSKADLTNTVKNIVTMAKETSRVTEPPAYEKAVEEHFEDAKEPVAGGGIDPKRRDPSSDEEEEDSSFYDEIFYDAVSDGAFVAPAKKENVVRAHLSNE